MRKLLMTGGSGRMGSLIRPLLAARGWHTTILDLAEPAALHGCEDFVRASICDREAVRQAACGADVVVHLGGFSAERPWADILRVNIDGAQAVLAASHAAGVSRVLMASSIHAIGYVHAADAGAPVVPCRPDTFYGVSKVVGEALGSVYADRFGMSVVSARIGTASPAADSERSLSTWLSPGDTVRLIEAVAELARPGHWIVSGISSNTRRWMSLAAGEEIGFVPQDDSEAYVGTLVDVGPPGEVDPELRLAGVFIDENHRLGGTW